jgi:hypothetical protein
MGDTAIPGLGSQSTYKYLTESPSSRLSVPPATRPVIGRCSIQDNGTPGRVYTQSLTSDNRTPAERAKSEAAFKRALICEDGALGAIACGQPFLQVESASVEVGGGGFSTGIETDGTAAGTNGTAMVPLGGGMAGGTQGVNYEVGGGDLPYVKGQVCIALKGSKKRDKAVSAEVSGAVAGVGTNGSNLCLIAQTPRLPAASVTVPVN